jgi:hypothetical protein
MSVLFKFITDNPNYYDLPEKYLETIDLIENYTFNSGYDRAVEYFGNDYVEIVSESEFNIKNKIFEHTIACDLYNTDVVEILLIKDGISEEITRFARIFDENAKRMIMKYDINHYRFIVRYRNKFDPEQTNVRYYIVDTNDISETNRRDIIVKKLTDIEIPVIKVKIIKETNISLDIIREIENHKINPDIGIVFYKDRIILE